MSFLPNHEFAQQNSFLRDPILFSIAEKLPTELLSSFEDLGSFTSSSEAKELARLCNQFRPLLRQSDEWGRAKQNIELHPAYHALLRRSRAAGLSTSLWETRPEEKGGRYKARALRLFLMAGIEHGHLQETIRTSAAISALINETELYQHLKGVLLSCQYDSSIRPLEQKKSISLGLAFTGNGQNLPISQRGIAHQISFDKKLGLSRYELQALKPRVFTPHADAFFLTAEVEGALSCFFVPRFDINEQLNQIKIDYLIHEAGYASCPIAQMNFDGSCGWLIGQIGAGEKIINDIEMMLHFDEAVISVGSLRYALQFALDAFQKKREEEKTSPLTERIFADIALDIAAAETLVFRLANAFDQAVKNKEEAAFARVMTPVTTFWVTSLAVPILSEIIAQLGATFYQEHDLLPRLLRDAVERNFSHKNNNFFVEDIVRSAEKAPNIFAQMVQQLEQSLGQIGSKTLDILQAASELAVKDIGTGRILTEQLAYAIAASSLVELNFPHIASAFSESRLRGPWRHNYGMLSPRYNPAQILQLLYPSL